MANEEMLNLSIKLQYTLVLIYQTQTPQGWKAELG